MAKPLGPTFGDEVHAAGLGGLPFHWGETDETIQGRENLTAEQNAMLDAVVVAHDATKPVKPEPAAESALLFDHENRLLALEGQPPLALGDFLIKTKTK